MNTTSVEKLNNKLFKSYKWYEETFSNVLRSTVEEFWNVSCNFKLVSVSNYENFFFNGSEYFATRMKLSKEEQFVIRLSKETVELFLNQTLGKRKDFVFEQMTELEAKILTSFNNLVFENSKGILNSEENLSDNFGTIDLTFLADDGSGNVAKIIFNIPEAYLSPQEIIPSTDKFDMGDFPSAMAVVNMYVGSTILPINDVKNIEKEDIIILEQSNINNMKLNFNDNEIGFKVSPDPSLIVSFDDNGSKDMSKADNIWDNIQVDVSAEFENVKISLGEIKQISEGLVIDVGSIYENKVYLKVENKPIATGELVIINDRYGVRVDEILKEAPQIQEENIPVQPQEPQELIEEQNLNEGEVEPQPQQELPDETQAAADEFDYKDFDVDDENI